MVVVTLVLMLPLTDEVRLENERHENSRFRRGFKRPKG